jgi:nitrate/nitrite transporter NarK
VYETREVGGTLSFPDFGTATELLLPGLWPEGNATIPGSTALWISANARAELKGGGSASVPLAGSLLLVAISVSAPYAAVLALMATFFMIELNEGAYWAATMRVARSDTGAATGVLNTGGNFAGIVSAPIVGALSGAGNWNATFVIGAVFAFVAAACWFAIDPDRRVVTDRPESSAATA